MARVDGTRRGRTVDQVGDAAAVLRVRAAILAGFLAPALALAGCAGPGGGTGVASGEADEVGSLVGLVVDEAVRPLEGAEVTAQPPGGTALRTATDANGTFRFTGLPAGSYAVEARLEFHLAAQTLAQVEAGVDDPPLVQLVLTVQADELPFSVAIVWDGYIGCAFTFGNLCSAPAQGGFDVLGDQSAHLFYQEFTDRQRIPDLVQGEAVWEATLPTSEELKPIYGWSEPTTWQAFGYLGTFHATSQPSPSFDRLTREELAEAEVGTANGLVVEFYSGGDQSDPTGLTVNQPVRLVLHAFYGALPPEDWRFVRDGAPPS